MYEVEVEVPAATAASSSMFDFMSPEEGTTAAVELPEPSAHSSSSVEVIDDSEAESKPQKKQQTKTCGEDATNTEKAFGSSEGQRCLVSSVCLLLIVGVIVLSVGWYALLTLSPILV